MKTKNFFDKLLQFNNNKINNKMYHPFVKSMDDTLYVHLYFLHELFKGKNNDIKHTQKIFGEHNFRKLNRNNKKPYYIEYNKAIKYMPFINDNFNINNILNIKNYILNNTEQILNEISICNSYIKSNEFVYVSKSKFYFTKTSLLYYIAKIIHGNIQLECSNENELFYSISFTINNKKYKYHQIYNRNVSSKFDKFVNYDCFYFLDYKPGEHTYHHEHSIDDINIVAQRLLMIAKILEIN